MEEEKDALKYAALMFKQLNGDLTPAEQQELENWLAADVRHRALLEDLQHKETFSEDIAFFDGLDVEADWLAVAARHNFKPVPWLIGWKRIAQWSVAAVLLGAIALVFKWQHSNNEPDKSIVATNNTKFKNDVLPGSSKAVLQLANGQTVDLNDNSTTPITEEDGTHIAQQTGQLVYNNGKPAGQEQETLFNTLSTPRAGQYQLTLPDGTKVWLNASSSIRFPLRFSGKERLVELTGEGYFEVAKNTAMPFRVKVNGMEVAVLGTHFNIIAYNGVTKTTLTEGAVKIQLPDKRSWQLVPGQQAVVKNDAVQVAFTDVEKAIAWKEGVFYFKEDDFEDIIAQIARWYDLDIEIKGKIPGKRISGNINREARLSQVLEMLNFVSGANFNIDGKKVTVIF
jgi:transmembrane sensor